MAGMTANQQKLFDLVKSKGQQRVQEVMRQANLDTVQRQELLEAKRKLESAILIRHMHLRKRFQGRTALRRLLNTGRIEHWFELGDFPGGFRDSDFRRRLINEFKIYGASREVQILFDYLPDSDRPIFGALDYIGKRASFSPLGHFGHYRFELKFELKSRATFTPSDSAMAELDQVYTWDGIEGVLATKPNEHFWFEYILSSSDPFSKEGRINYIEVQILGGVMLSDIARLHYPTSDQFDRHFFADLRRLERSHDIELIGY